MSLRITVALAALAVLSPAAWAQGYPSKPVRVIVTFPPGGTPAIYGRVMSAELQKIWNQSGVVEYRTGADTARVPDDGAKTVPPAGRAHEERKVEDAGRHRPDEGKAAAKRAGGRRDPAGLRHHRLVRLHGAGGRPARDREKDPRRLRRRHQAAGFPRAPGQGRNRAGGKHAGRIRSADQDRPRPLGKDRQGRGCQTRLAAPPRRLRRHPSSREEGAVRPARGGW